MKLSLSLIVFAFGFAKESLLFVPATTKHDLAAATTVVSADAEVTAPKGWIQMPLLRMN